MSPKFKSLLPILLVLLFTLPAIRPLFHPGFFPMHDDQQVIRLAELDTALRGGQFPVRWVARLGFGYGYPLFVFYPPFVYYLGEVFHLLGGLSFILSIKLVFAAAFLGAALSMYAWTKHHFGPAAGFLAALFYTYAPYKAVDAYVRGALAELFSFVWLPLILLSVDRLAELTSGKRRDRKRLIGWGSLLALSYALLMLTHNLIALPFTGILLLYVLFKLIAHHRRSFFLFLFSSFLLLGLTLSAFFWIPALAEKQHTLVDNILLSERYTYSLHYVQPSQLWNSIWGYAGSAPLGEIDGFSLKIGKLHLGLSVITFLFTAVLLLASKITFKLKTAPPAPRHWSLILTASCLLVFSAFMTTSFSGFIWGAIQPLQYIQFPWRFLTFTALFSSLLAGVSVWLVQKCMKNTYLVTGYWLLVAGLLLQPNLKYFQPKEYLDVTDADYLSDDFAKWHISKTSFEFVPKGAATRIEPPLNITQLDIDRADVATAPFTIVSGDPTVQIKQDAPHQTVLEIISGSPSIIQLNTFAFPGWQTFLNGEPVAFSAGNPLRLIQVAVPAGDHQLQAVFTNTPVRTIANAVSTLAFLVFLVLVFGYAKPLESSYD